MNIQEMEYKISKDCNPNMKTRTFLTKADKIECFSKYCTNEVIRQSTILKDLIIKKLWQFQWEIVTLKIRRCTLS